MFKNFFIAAVRNLKKNRVYAAINVTGLALGIACCLIIFVIVRYETSFDDYHSKADRIYRINLDQTNSNGRQLNGCNYTPLAEAVREDVTGLEAVTGVYCLYSYQFGREKDLYEDKYAFFADKEYFDVFDVRWLAGNQEQALTVPNTAIVTDAFAEKFLGGQDNALGSTLLLENKLTLTVTGIVGTPPSNTDHPYSMLISFSSLPAFYPESVDNWKDVSSAATYVVFHEDTRQEQVYPQLERVIQKYLEKDFAKNTKFFLMALNDNHDRNFDYNSFTYDFPVPVMVILSIMAGMIAFIACINFVNLATAQSLTRAKEVGVRKTMGSSRFHLILQYMSEAFVVTLLSVITGMVLARIGMALLNERYGGQYLQFHFLEEPSTLFFIACIMLLITFLAGFYPAIVLSGFRPLSALKSQKNTGKSGGMNLRRGLVLLQFTGAQMLILVTIIMVNQIDHFKDRPTTYDADTIVSFPYLRGNDNQQHNRLNQELKRVPGVLNYTFASGPPMGGDHVEFYGDAGEEQKFKGLLNYVDENYVATFSIDLIAGRNFSTGQAQATSEVLVNETLVNTLGLDGPQAAIGNICTVNNEQVKIRGVIRDFYTKTMSTRIDPVMLQYNPDKIVGVSMIIDTKNIPAALAGIESAWQKVYPDFICRYQFMDVALKNQFGFFNTIFSFMGVAAFLAIFIGCMGLYGLVSFMAVQRTKEIGIRKVLGATVSNIIMMFTKESIVLVLIAFVIAAPLARILGIAMLMELPERIDPGITIFLVTLAGSMLIAWITVGCRSFSAATQSPADSLRHE